ncbi:MAG TPA: hypothetical protein VLA97_08690 [Nocardioidaceae bacterium]|nr:hypothetical protein [Nocardioidaceae bacterium]HSE70820.1 hypothetical protein [Nocardioidaceae bacterium]
MRSEWVPVSAAALVTGVMALVLAQMLNPGGSEDSPAAQMLVAAEYPGRWLAMSVLFFGGAVGLVLGMPALMTLFQERRGRGLGMTGVAVFVVGCVGVGGLAALMLMFRSLALQTIATDTLDRDEINLVTASLEQPGLMIPLNVWVYAFILGVLLIALGLFRARQVPNWVPWLLMAFLAMQVVVPLLGEGTDARVASAVGLILLAGGFTGVATNAAGPRSEIPVTHSLA